MKKSARQVIRSWGQTLRNLKPGEILQVTSRGKPLVEISKPVAAKTKLPDFAARARDAGLSNSKIGDRLLKRILEDEALS